VFYHEWGRSSGAEIAANVLAPRCLHVPDLHPNEQEGEARNTPALLTTSSSGPNRNRKNNKGNPRTDDHGRCNHNRHT
jgi:hypothetical protein